VRLGDFGVAEQLSTLTRHRATVGTPYWMAPEMVLRKGTGARPLAFRLRFPYATCLRRPAYDCVGSPTISLCSVLASVLAMTLSATDRRARRQDLGDGRLPREVRRLVAGNHSHRDGRECRCRRPSPVSTTPCRLWWLLRVCLARTAGSSVAGWSLPPCPAARPPAVVVVNAAAAAAAVPHLTSPDSPDFT
jgi:serine/threonine protein kinase